MLPWCGDSGHAQVAQHLPSPCALLHSKKVCAAHGLQEVVHHIPSEQVPALFAGMAAQLRPGGTVVVITRPQDVDYPLFSRAREVSCCWGRGAGSCVMSGGWGRSQSKGVGLACALQVCYQLQRQSPETATVEAAINAKPVLLTTLNGAAARSGPTPTPDRMGAVVP